MMVFKDRKDIVESSITVQDACNPRGVANSLVCAMAWMAENEKLDTKALERDPALRLFVMKLCDLFNISFSFDDFKNCYEAVQKEREYICSL